MKGFKAHDMYKTEKAETHKEHLDLKSKGYEHGPYKQTNKKTSHEKNAGMDASERKAYNNKTGGNVQGPQPEGGSRKDSYCARSAGIPKCKDPDKHGKCKNDYAREDWKC